MNSRRGVEWNTYLAQVDLLAFFGPRDQIAQEAIDSYTEVVMSAKWGLRQDGAIMSINSYSNLPVISVVVDTDDHCTVEAFNALPAYFNRELMPPAYDLMKLKVNIVPRGILTCWEEDEEDEEDVLTCRPEGIFLLSIQKSWLSMQVNNTMLMAERRRR